MSERNAQLRQLASAWNDAWNSRDAGQLAAFFADDGTFYEPGLPAGPIAGKDGVTASAEATWRDWPEAKFETVTTVVDGDRVCLEWRSSATHKSGTDVRLEGVDVLEFAGDKISACRIYFDVHGRNQALS